MKVCLQWEVTAMSFHLAKDNADGWVQSTPTGYCWAVHFKITNVLRKGTSQTLTHALAACETSVAKYRNLTVRSPKCPK
jgi:hypothetical protein